MLRKAKGMSAKQLADKGIASGKLIKQKAKKLTKENPMAKGFTDATKGMSKGIKSTVVPAIVAGTVAGKASNIEKKASSYLAFKAKKAINKANPEKAIPALVGGSIGAVVGYKGAKKHQEDIRKKKQGIK